MSAEEFFGLDGNDCTAEKYPITYEEILSSLVSNADDGENDNNVSEENDATPSQLTTEEFEKTINSMLRAPRYSPENGLEMHTLALKCENVCMKARIQRTFLLKKANVFCSKTFQKTMYDCNLIYI